MAGSLVGTKKTENNLRFITPLLWSMTFVTYNWTLATEVLGHFSLSHEHKIENEMYSLTV